MVRRVIIVEDDPRVRRGLCDLFQRESGFTVCGEAGDGRYAIEQAQRLQPDLIVTDLSMPVMNGLEVARTVQRLMPAVPVIIYTAHSDRFVEKEAYLAGACAVISKSAPVNTLIAEARRLFEKSAAA